LQQAFKRGLGGGDDRGGGTSDLTSLWNTGSELFCVKKPAKGTTGGTGKTLSEGSEMFL